MKHSLFAFCALFCLSLFAPLQAAEMTLEQQRAMFLQAEQAIKQNDMDKAAALVTGLGGYPLTPWLEYQIALPKLNEPQAAQIFLSRHPHTRLAALLRHRWLERLAENGAWATFVEFYQDTDNLSVQCHYAYALAQTGRQTEAFAHAKKLWLSGRPLPDACEKLYAAWRESPGFAADEFFQRQIRALASGNPALAEALLRQSPPALLAAGERLRTLHAKPRSLLSCQMLDPAQAQAGSIFAHAIHRLAGEDALLAQTAWALYASRFAIPAEDTRQLDRNLALALAGQQYKQAQAYLLELPTEAVDAQVRAWRVRAALANGDWKGVLEGIALLGAEGKKQAVWLYWQARALQQLGDEPAAQALYREAAKERDYYGFLAADRVGVGYALGDQPVAVSASDEQRLADKPGFAAIRELLALGRGGEARGEWFHATQSLPPQDLMVAAKLAQHWGLDNLAINTVAKAGYWDDLGLRFPAWNSGLLQKIAESQGADLALVYALVRRESAFDPNAGSPAGAVGLMQLMPNTGNGIAQRLNEPAPSRAALLEPERNLRYGTAYFQELRERFGNHLVLAVTAYNAGPNRVEHWLPPNQSQPADVWVETIPYNETRQYVQAVLAYAIIYQNRLHLPASRIGAWLQDIPAGGKATAKPDRPLALPFCRGGNPAG